MATPLPLVTKGSKISSAAWNQVIYNLELAYSIYQTLENGVQQLKNINSQTTIDNYETESSDACNVIVDLLDYLQSPTLVSSFPDYISAIPTANPGMPLTAEMMNSLSTAVQKLYNTLMYTPAPQISAVSSDEIAKSAHWNKIVYAVNNLPNIVQPTTVIKTQLISYATAPFVFLDVLTVAPTTTIDTVVKALFAYSPPPLSYFGFNLYGSGQVLNLFNCGGPGFDKIYGNLSLENVYIFRPSIRFHLHDNVYAQNIYANNNDTFLHFYDYSSAQNVYVTNVFSEVHLEDNAFVYNLYFYSSNALIATSDAASITNLYVYGDSNEITVYHGVNLYLCGYENTVVFNGVNLYLCGPYNSVSGSIQNVITDPTICQQVCSAA
ncbi:hypothetical protein ARV1_gp29 [Acidianus rod-shaped virus 1]|uniref:Uncharacterized protein n=1 Tax=Acidianus rod-shaped virus 1 TaxID=309181 RepID=Q50I42_9VIRU|nr:hypothetical protein ARV1_gp29 [Acidianus rod-shaped virus 1]CAI44184.1 hypothetical protein [Acidianus rod-shaped virus 1]